MTNKFKSRQYSQHKSHQGARNYRAGHWAEIMAAAYFLLCGYWPLCRRYKTPMGEIDLILWRPKLIVCVEIKRRRILDIAAESITPRQRARIRRAADYFLSRHPRHAAATIRFDDWYCAPKCWPRHERNVGLD